MKGADLDALFRRAVREGKEPRYVIHFRDFDLAAEIHLMREKLP